jgi:hypothetical protein
MITLDGGVDKILVAQSDWGPSWWGDATAEDIVRNYTSKDECLVDFLGEMMTELRSPKHARRKNCCLHFLSSPFSRRERQFSLWTLFKTRITHASALQSLTVIRGCYSLLISGSPRYRTRREKGNIVCDAALTHP